MVRSLTGPHVAAGLFVVTAFQDTTTHLATGLLAATVQLADRNLDQVKQAVLHVLRAVSVLLLKGKQAMSGVFNAQRVVINRVRCKICALRVKVGASQCLEHQSAFLVSRVAFLMQRVHQNVKSAIVVVHKTTEGALPVWHVGLAAIKVSSARFAANFAQTR